MNLVHIMKTLVNAICQATNFETATNERGNDLRFLRLQTAHAIIDEAVHV